MVQAASHALHHALYRGVANRSCVPADDTASVDAVRDASVEKLALLRAPRMDFAWKSHTLSLVHPNQVVQFACDSDDPGIGAKTLNNAMSSTEPGRTVCFGCVLSASFSVSR